MIAAGATLHFVARGTTTAAQFQLVFTPGMLESEVSRVLGFTMDVIAIDVMTDDTVITGTLPWSYTANVSVKTRTAFAKSADVGSFVANAFFQASGAMPNSVTEGFAMDAPNLSWKIVALVGGVALLLIAMRVR